MIITRKPLSRRTVLRGLGTAMSLPLLEAMLPNARAADAVSRPKRLQVLYSPNGMIMENYTPAKTGHDFPLSPTLQPFAPFKSRLNVITGLGHLEASDGHAQGCSGFLTGTQPRPTEGSDLLCGISIDQVIASRYADQTLVPSLELGIDQPSLLGSCVPNYSCTYTNTLSWRNPTSAQPVTINPRDVFERMFGDGDALDADGRLKQRKRRTSVLDYVSTEASRLSGALGANDRQKMDQYLDSVRDIEKRVQQSTQHDVGAYAADLKRPSGIPEVFADHVKMMIDLQVLAMQADITRVGSFMIGREVSNRAYPEIGIADAHHMLSHYAGDAVKVQKISSINRMHMQYFAYYLQRMSETRDGDGSLLDSTLVLIGAGFGDPNVHDCKNLPILVLGGGLSGNRHIQVPKGTSISNLLLTVLNRFDVPVDQWTNSTGRLDQLLTA